MTLTKDDLKAIKTLFVDALAGHASGATAASGLSQAPLARDVTTAVAYADGGLAIDGHVVREGTSLWNMTKFLAEPLGPDYAGADVRLVHIGFTNEGDLTPAEEAESAASGGGWSGVPQRAQQWRSTLRTGYTAETWLAERLRQIDSTAGTPGGGPSGG